jgi:hypothetical protein
LGHKAGHCVPAAAMRGIVLLAGLQQIARPSSCPSECSAAVG